MYFSAKFIAVVALALGATAAPAPATHAVHEKRSYTPSQWAKRSKVPSDVVLPVRIGLSQGNLHKGYDLLMDVYDVLPTEIIYGRLTI